MGGVGQLTGVLDLCSTGDGEYTILLLWPVSDETVKLRIPNSVREKREPILNLCHSTMKAKYYNKDQELVQYLSF